MRIAIITDAWKPQINGVVTTLENTRNHLEAMGHQALMITPESFNTIPCPSYRSIRLALFPKTKLTRLMNEFSPQAIHIATEGPLGFATRKYCKQHKLAFTTSYHTRFPEYIRLRAPVPLSISYCYMRWFHSAAVRTLVPTPSQRTELEQHRMNNLVVWSRGVNTELFKPERRRTLHEPYPVIMYMGRVAIEKNIGAFLNLSIAGTKYVVGDGPDLKVLKNKHPDVRFVGFKFGEELASYLAAADVFVFPSKTDTFGLVLLEAMACGVPVAAYPVTGPIDVVQDNKTGALRENLAEAVKEALKLDGGTCREYAIGKSWQACAQQFAAYLVDNTTR